MNYPPIALSPISSTVIVTNNLRSLPKEVRNLLAGGIAGMVAKSIVAPIDRIKILYQVTSAPFKLRNIPRVAYGIIQTEGLPALWKGNLATMIRVFPYSGIQFMVFHRCKTYFLMKKDHRDDFADNGASNFGATASQNATGTLNRPSLSPLESLLAGSFAGAVSVLFTYPLDLTRAQLAVLKKKKKDAQGRGGSQGFLEVLVGNYKKGGVGGLFRGISPTLLGILPYSGIAFTINEQAKRQVYLMKGKDPTTIERMICGALSGIVAQSMTYPLEVTRRRMQTIGVVPTSGGDTAVNVLGGNIITSTAQDAAKHSKEVVERDTKLEKSKIKLKSKMPTLAGKPPTMIATMAHLMKEQGVRGFFKGLTMNFIKGPIAFSVSFTTFDLVQGLMETDEERIAKLGGKNGQ